MQLTLKVLTYCDQHVPDSQSRTFETFPIIIGRSPACDYYLKDPSQYVSSNHAVVLVDGEQLLLQDTSSNGVYVNGVTEPIGRKRTVNLNDNDTLAIGDYKLGVTIAYSQSNSTDDPFGNHAHQSPSNSQHYDPFRGDEPAWVSQATEEKSPDPNDWGLSESPASSAKPSASPSESDWADWPDEFVQSSANTPLVAEQQKSEPPQKRRQNISQPSDVNAAYLPNQKTKDKQPGLVDNPVVPKQQRVLADNYSAALSDSNNQLKILLRAASLNESEFSHLDNSVVLEQTGRLLEQMVDAMMVLLRSRAEVKNYIRSDNTTLARADNNPLKFSASSSDALAKLLSNESHGYLQSDDAIQEAVEDLKLHQIAMLEGMKLAVKSLLLKFDPNKLAKKLEQDGGIAANIPVTREAKLWELFCEQYDAIREEATNDFKELLGDEFRKIYEQQTRNKQLKPNKREPDF